ncbi:MAG: hypothetical protein ACYTG0_26700 [Planctomycetota bacterium]
MAKFFHPLIMVLARATESELARYVEYLKAENRILRSRLPKRVVCTRAERSRLIKLGKPLTLAYTRGWAANSPNSRIRLKAELDRAHQEVAHLLRCLIALLTVDSIDKRPFHRGGQNSAHQRTGAKAQTSTASQLPRQLVLGQWRNPSRHQEKRLQEILLQ